MKRDLDLFRSILVELGAGPAINGHLLSIEGHAQDEVSYHVKLLQQAGFVEARSVSNATDGLRMIPTSITHHGHEFLEATRNAMLWEKAKQFAKEKTVTLALEAIYAALKRGLVQLVTGGPLNL